MNVKDLCIDKFNNCPTHPEFLLELICTDKMCIEPMCRRCVPQHRLIHQQMNTTDSIRQLSEVKVQYLKKQGVLQSKQKSINPHRVSEIITTLVDDYFKRKNKQIDGQNYNEISEVKSLLDILVQQGRAQLPKNFKSMFFEFLRNNLILNSDSG